MLRGLSFVRHKFYIVLDSLLVLVIAAGLFGCGPTSSSQEIIVPIVICTPNTPLVNVYNAASQPWANTIFEVAFPSYIPTPIPPNPSPYNEDQISSARYTAFLQLIKETTRWSDTKRINLQDSSEAMITLTYISPELVQAVFLNKVLQDRSLTFDFQNQLRNVLNSIAARNELLFLLTVTTTNNNINQTRHTIEIPIEGMVLNNSKNLTVTHSHDDHNLEQVIDTSSNPVFGYLAYPLALVSETQCEWVLDPKYNTNIVVTAPYITVDDVKSKNAYFWTIPYAPLINSITPSSTYIWTLPPGYDKNLMTPFASPPSDINQSNYWQDFARFVWNQFTLGNY